MISVIIPIYNNEEHLHTCLNSVLKQTFQDFEIICIDDGSTDSSVEILKYFAQKDSRVKLFKNNTKKGLNYSKEFGLNNANKKYVFFLNAEDWIALNAFEILITQAEKENLGLIMFKNMVYPQNTNESFIHDYFNVNFIDKYDSNVLNPGKMDKIVLLAMIYSPLNKFYSKSFLNKINLHSSNENEILFKNITKTKKILILNEYLNISNKREDYTKTKIIYKKLKILNKVTNQILPDLITRKSIKNNHILIFNMLDDLNEILIKKDLYNYFNYAFLLFKLLKIKEYYYTCEEDYKNKFYENMRNEFFNMRLDTYQLNQLPLELYQFYINVLNYDEHEKFIILDNNIKKELNYINKEELDSKIIKFKKNGLNKTKRNRKIIISLTSIPEHIHNVHFCLYSLLTQELKPDEVILWLSENQFPNKDEDLPKNILNLKRNGLKIKWCEDMSSYKKILHSLNDFPNDIIVTVDDNIYYPEDWLKKLHKTHVKYPNNIISQRCYKICFNDDKTMKNFEQWPLIKEKTNLSFLNFPITDAGILFPPKSLNTKIQDYNMAKKLSSKNEDIWIWGMAVLNKTKIKNIGETSDTLHCINPLRKLNILSENELANIKSKENNINIKKIISEFPEISGIINSEGIL